MLAIVLALLYLKCLDAGIFTMFLAARPVSQICPLTMTFKFPFSRRKLRHEDI